jgi:hypothetical protein
MKKALIILILLAAVLGGAYYFTQGEEIQGSIRNVTTEAKPMPDFVVTKLELEDGKLMVSTDNDGTETSATGFLYVWIDDMLVHEHDWSGDLTNFKAGELNDDIHKVRVCVDATDEVGESDEDNNCEEKTFGL